METVTAVSPNFDAYIVSLAHTGDYHPFQFSGSLRFSLPMSGTPEVSL